MLNNWYSVVFAGRWKGIRWGFVCFHVWFAKQNGTGGLYYSCIFITIYIISSTTKCVRVAFVNNKFLLHFSLSHWWRIFQIKPQRKTRRLHLNVWLRSTTQRSLSLGTKTQRSCQLMTNMMLKCQVTATHWRSKTASLQTREITG